LTAWTALREAEMPNQNTAAIKATLQEVAEGLRWIAEQLSQIREELTDMESRENEKGPAPFIERAGPENAGVGSAS
jgi:hypothetical protein